MTLTTALELALKVSSVWKCLGGEFQGEAIASRPMKGGKLTLVARKSLLHFVSFDIINEEIELIWRGQHVLGTYLNLPGVNYAGFLSDEILEKEDWEPS